MCLFVSYTLTHTSRPLSPASQLQYFKQQQQQLQQNQQTLQTPATPVAHFQGAQSMMGGRPYSPTRNPQYPPQYSGHTPSGSIGIGMVRTLSGNHPTVSGISGNTSGGYRSHTMPLSTLSTTPTTGSIRSSNYPPYNTVAGGYYELPSQASSYVYQHAMPGSQGQPISGTGFTNSGHGGMRQMSNDSAYDSGLPSKPSGGSGSYDNRSTSPYDPHYGGNSGYPHNH